MSNINLIHGDCLVEMQKLIDEGVRVDAVITSPPYNKKFFCPSKIKNAIWGKHTIDYNSYEDNLPIQEYEKWMVNFINLSLSIIKDNGSVFFNHKPIRHNNSIYHPLSFILSSDGVIYQEIIWNRLNSPNIRKDVLLPCTERIYWLCKNKPISYRDNLDKEYISEVWNISPSQDKEHPATFPIKLASNCIKLSTNKNEVILDPFMGSGTTGVACINTNRKFIGIELDDKYFKIAEERISTHAAQMRLF